jgi:hypothetical protein
MKRFSNGLLGPSQLFEITFEGLLRSINQSNGNVPLKFQNTLEKMNSAVDSLESLEQDCHRGEIKVTLCAKVRY